MILGKIENLGILCGDAAEILSNVFPLSTISQLFINHPQPPEHIDRGKAASATNQGQHLLTSSFFRLLHSILVPGGTVTIVTDNQNYARLLSKIICDEVSTIFRSGHIENQERFLREHLNDKRERFVLWRGNPDQQVGHNTISSSYFDRLWDNGEHTRRWILFLQAI